MTCNFILEYLDLRMRLPSGLDCNLQLHTTKFSVGTLHLSSRPSIHMKVDKSKEIIKAVQAKAMRK